MKTKTLGVKLHNNFERFNAENEGRTGEMMRMFERMMIFEKVGSRIITAYREKTDFVHLDNSMISFKNLDRLYHMYYHEYKNKYNDEYYGMGFLLIGRMNFDEKLVFIMITGKLDKNDSLGYGYMFLCVDPDLLMKAVQAGPYYMVNYMRLTLINSGIRLCTDFQNFIKYRTAIEDDVYPFHDLSVRGSSIEALRSTLQQRKNILPKYLLDNIDDFIEYYELVVALNK